MTEKRIKEPDERWISVFDELPEPGTIVIATYDIGGALVLGFEMFNGKFHSYVTAWMPAPEPYGIGKFDRWQS